MKLSVSPIFERVVRDRHRGPAQVGVGGDYRQPESTATGAPPTRVVLVVPDGVTTGAATATSTLSAAATALQIVGRTVVDDDRKSTGCVVLVLVVENVTDCKAVWY